MILLVVLCVILLLIVFEQTHNIFFLYKDIKGKKNAFVNIMFLFFLIIAMGANTNSPDSEMYISNYSSNVVFTRDIGFGYLMFFFHKLGVSYQVFKLMVATAGVLLINNTIKKYCSIKFRRIVYILYFLYPFFMDVVQVRNFLAMSIFIFAYSYLEQFTIKNLVKYLCLIVVAGFIQKLLFLFVIVPFIFLIEKNKNTLKTIFALTFTFSVIIFFNRNILTVLKSFLLKTIFIELEGFSAFLGTTTGFGGLACCVIASLNFFLLYTIYIKIRNNSLICKNRFNFFQNTIKLNVLLSLLFPMYIIHVEFFRIFRNVEVLNWICIAIFFEARKHKYVRCSKSYLTLIYLQLVVTLGFTIFYAYVFGGNNFLDSIIKNTFISNWILGF